MAGQTGRDADRKFDHTFVIKTQSDLPFGMTRYKELTGVSVDRHSPSVVRRGSRRARFFPSNTQTHRI